MVCVAPWAEGAGGRDLWTGTVAGWVPRNLREPPGIVDWMCGESRVSR